VKPGALRRAREWAGVALKDFGRYRRLLNAPDASYLAICNRAERVELAPDGSGYRCNWQWTSDLHAPKVMPGLGLALMRRALEDHPVVRARALTAQGAPEVSFVIGHRGMARLPHLVATLETIAAQRAARVECIVVEQDTEARLTGRLPDWVRHIHTPLPRADLAYCRSWAFNVGVKHASAPLLILHDNDILLPVDYASSVVSRFAQGYEAANLKRFIFYLGEAHTRAVFGGAGLTDQAPQAIMQNAEGGGSVAITREGYERIGGLDESFVGWGGEDNEFWERAQTLKVWPYAHLPLVHLWHAAQPGKHSAGNETQALQRERSGVPVARRIAQLRALSRGEMSGPRAGLAKEAS
jgi:hypothetical protein